MLSIFNINKKSCLFKDFQNIFLYIAQDGDIHLHTNNGKRYNLMNRKKVIIKLELIEFLIYMIFAMLI